MQGSRRVMDIAPRLRHGARHEKRVRLCKLLRVQRFEPRCGVAAEGLGALDRPGQPLCRFRRRDRPRREGDQIGCGPSHFLGELRARGFTNIAGVDACPDYAGPDIVAGDALDYLDQQPDGSVAALIAWDVLEHMDADTIRQLFRIAARKVTQRIVLRVPNGAAPLGLNNQYGDVSHRIALTEVSLQQLAFDAGLSCRFLPEPLAYPRTFSALMGIALWPIYRATTRMVLAAFGQRVRVLTANLVAIIEHNAASTTPVEAAAAAA